MGELSTIFEHRCLLVPDQLRGMLAGFNDDREHFGRPLWSVNVQVKDDPTGAVYYYLYAKLYQISGSGTWGISHPVLFGYIVYAPIPDDRALVKGVCNLEEYPWAASYLRVFAEKYLGPLAERTVWLESLTG